METKTKNSEKGFGYSGRVAEFQLKRGWTLMPHQMETPTGVSKTVPDDSYSIRDLIKKYASGLDPNVTLLGEFTGEDSDDLHDEVDLAQAARADYNDVQEIQLQARQTLEELQKKREAQNKNQASGEGLERSRKYERKEVDADDLRNEAEEENTSKSEPKKGAKKEQKGSND